MDRVIDTCEEKDASMTLRHCETPVTWKARVRESPLSFLLELGCFFLVCHIEILPLTFICCHLLPTNFSTFLLSFYFLVLKGGKNAMLCEELKGMFSVGLRII